MKSTHCVVTGIKILNCIKSKRVSHIVRTVISLWNFVSYMFMCLCRVSCSVHSLRLDHIWMRLEADIPYYTLSEYLASRGAEGIHSPWHNWDPFKAPGSCWLVGSTLEQSYPVFIGSIKAVGVSMCTVPLKWLGGSEREFFKNIKLANRIITNRLSTFKTHKRWKANRP